MNIPVTSREYKLMLNTDRFKDRAEGARIFFNLIKLLIEKEGGKTEAQNEEERRKTSYLDTRELALHQSGFALRLRDEGNKFQINLKYRASDRYVSAARDLSSPVVHEPKFEEDILPPFTSKFSHSCSIKTTEPPDLGDMQKVVSLFPGLAGLGIDMDSAVKTVNGFTALEVVLKFCKFRFDDSPKMKASLSFWYQEDESGWPMVAEFSFDYDEKKPDGAPADRLEDYPSQAVEKANRFFSALQQQTSWLDFNGTTKTAFAIEGL